MDYITRRALELLRLGTGIPAATFREEQEEAIRHIVEGRGRLLVVQKTGWGKSNVYFIATKLLREAGFGPALLISPLLSLMRNQIEAAERMGVRAVTINASNKAEWASAEDQLENDDVDILLISPERLANDDFRERILPDIAARLALLVIDEAHCISDWGHDFRPDYRRIERIARTLPGNIRLLATTATANNRVMDDLKAVLGPSLHVLRGELNRPSLLLQTISLPSREERLAWLAEQLASIPGSGIIYALTIRDAEQVTCWLRSEGLDAQCYTSRSRNRQELEQALLKNRVKALVATTALGMGFDKPDLAFVIHYQTPGSVVHYYQQVGRAGRGLDAAYGVLLSGTEDKEIIDYFIRNAFPTKDEVGHVLAALENEPAGLSIPQLCGSINVRENRIKQTVKLLSLESPAPIAQQGFKWQLTAAQLSDAFWERVERLTALRREEQRQMQEYVTLKSGHMNFLIQALDGKPEAIEPPDIPALPMKPQQEKVRRVVEFLRRTCLPIEPRKRWPDGGLPKYDLRGFIRNEHQAETGRALCQWGDAGWGRLVRIGKYKHERFSDDLVSDSFQLFLEWDPQPTPTWVTCIPSRRQPTLVRDFASRLATELGLPFRDALVKVDNRPQQKGMANSIQQARNVDGSLDVVSDLIIPGPALLVDDMVDSRWTLTIATWLLRTHGCGKVFPFALANTATD
ncbi:MAG: RecQ family ATP-dependent DNA helicase [Chloroflexi bacterium]|nr:RecQ family ATP-dependent DNA helicase [Chloroflexota bacterium]